MDPPWQTWAMHIHQTAFTITFQKKYKNYYIIIIFFNLSKYLYKTQLSFLIISYFWSGVKLLLYYF